MVNVPIFTPKQRTVALLTGDADAIIARGNQIESLGKKMQSSANLLESVKNGDSQQKGKAVEALKETIGDSYTTLREAGKMYEPSGPVIRKYGEAVEQWKPVFKFRAEAAEDRYAEFAALPGSVEPRGAGGLLQPDEGSPEATKNAEEDAAKLAKWEELQAALKSWDSGYDSWEEAFDTACNDLGGVLDKGIEDGWSEFWQNVADFLSWAGLIVGIAALIIGGPIIGAIAAAIAVASLLVTVIQWGMGDKGLLDVVLSAVAVIPIGKIGLLKNAAGGKAFVKEIGSNFKPSTYKKGIEGYKSLKSVVSGASGNKWAAGAKELWKQGDGGPEIVSKLLTGKTLDKWGDSLWSPMGSKGLMFEYGHSVVGNVVKLQGWHSQITGGESWSKNPVVNFLW